MGNVPLARVRVAPAHESRVRVALLYSDDSAHLLRGTSFGVGPELTFSFQMLRQGESLGAGHALDRWRRVENHGRRCLDFWHGNATLLWQH